MKKFFSIVLLLVFGMTYNTTVQALDNNRLSIDKKIGMNGHVDVPKDILYAGGVVREYHNFGWSMTSDKKMYFARFSWWDFDGYYKDLYEHGITILPCIQMGEQSIFNRDRSEKPVVLGDDTTDPMSYRIHSNYLFNYAARYGSTKVDKSRLNLDPNDTVKTGLGYITYYEDWNEPDKTWLGPDAQFNSTELAAMLSADYDGHEKALGENYGIKNADPNSKLVMGGMAGGSTMVTWLTEMQEWANTNRTDKKLPLDVINYHQYAGTHSPENSTFVEDANKIIEWRNNNAPDKEIWITEFGWDTNTLSPRSAPTLEAQRDWIIREYLIGDRIGLDRMTVYDALNDGPSTDPTQYSTSGLATKGSEGTVKKPSWYGVNTLKNTLKGYKFVKAIKEDSNMYIYKYTNGTDFYYVLWSPTENGTIINNYNLNIDIKDYDKASLTTLKDKEPLGVTTNLNINDNKVVVNVSESPIFVKVTTKVKEENKNVIPDNNTKQEDKTETKEETNKVIEEENKVVEQETKNETTTTTQTNESQNNIIVKQNVLVKEDNNVTKKEETKKVETTKTETTTSTDKKGGIKRIPAVNGVIEKDDSNRNNNKELIFLISMGVCGISILACLIILIKRWN